MSDTFDVDLDELHHTAGRMAAAYDALHLLATDLQRRVDALHHTWTGEAAAAHGAAQGTWAAGFDGMRQALEEMQAAGRLAHRNYDAAATANLRMWQQVG